jgi:hypothetical protein
MAQARLEVVPAIAKRCTERRDSVARLGKVLEALSVAASASKKVNDADVDGAQI